MFASPAWLPAGKELLAVPIVFLNVTLLDRQAGPTPGTPRGKDFSTAAGGHSLAEPVDACPAAFFRLIRAFRHDFSSKKAASNAAGLYQPPFRPVKKSFLTATYDTIEFIQARSFFASCAFCAFQGFSSIIILTEPVFPARSCRSSSSIE